MTPEAVFEIIGAGSEIPSGFVQADYEDLILEGPWVGVAICATVSVHHVDGYMKSKYIVTAHVHLGGKRWKIPIPIHFLVAESETQLVFYWTVTDDLQRIVGSSQKSNFGVSFSVEPEDNYLQVTKFGIRFIHKEYILHLKRREDSMIRVGDGMKQFSYLRPGIYERDLEACKGCTYMDHNIRKIVDFIFDNGSQQCSLDGIYQITKGILEMKQEYPTICKYLPTTQDVCLYYEIILGTSALYNDFIELVKDINDGWLSVKLSLERIVVKTRADNYSYQEILQQLDDLEAAKSVGFSDKFIKTVESIFIRTFDIAYNLRLDARVQFMFSPSRLSVKPKEKVLAKLLIIITAVLCTVAAYMGDSELLEAMKQTNLSSLFLHLIRAFTDKKRMEGGHFILKTQYCNCELKISDFCDNGNLLQELMNKMGRSTCFTKENEDEMTSVIDRLQNNIQKVSNIIQEMSSHADQYSHHQRK
ncbi:hypothetical protein M8C21_016617, partial [Ambrosia artemisiifolia]